jgi:hypothetical protein
MRLRILRLEIRFEIHKISDKYGYARTIEFLTNFSIHNPNYRGVKLFVWTFNLNLLLIYRAFSFSVFWIRKNKKV